MIKPLFLENIKSFDEGIPDCFGWHMVMPLAMKDDTILMLKMCPGTVDGISIEMPMIMIERPKERELFYYEYDSVIDGFRLLDLIIYTDCSDETEEFGILHDAMIKRIKSKYDADGEIKTILTNQI